ncbi:MAG: hemolysin family protein [Tissierellia bacterium]|nr:hemolysin family protein [Tissierellia bacterium]
MENITLNALIIMALVGLSAFFSSSETAIVSTNKFKVRKLMDDKVKNATLLHRLVNDPSRTISAILIGNNIVNIAATSISTAIFVRAIPKYGTLVATIVMTLLVLVFGEIIPKNLANRNPETYAIKVTPYIHWIAIFLTPFVKMFNALAKKFYGPESKDEFTEDDLITIINVSHEEGVLEGDEKTMIQKIFEFTDSQAKDIMTPRTSIVALPLDIDPDELMGKVKELNFSRIPIYDDNIDDIVGILNVRDLVGKKLDDKFSLKALLRPAYFQYESKSNIQLLSELKRKKYTMAVILDEYGGTSGIVTIEDIVEEIVGDISDEYDEEDNPIRKIGNNHYSIKGDTDIEDINERLGIHLESKDYESIGGYVIGLAGKFPKDGEMYQSANYEFFIEKAEPTKVEKVRLRIKKR